MGGGWKGNHNPAFGPMLQGDSRSGLQSLSLARDRGAPAGDPIGPHRYCMV